MLALTTVFMLQILFESLPISSSGHCALLNKLNAAPLLSPLQDFCAHIPTLLIVLLFFAQQWYQKITNSSGKAVLKFITIADALPVFAYLIKAPQLFLNTPLYIGLFLTACMLIASFWAFPAQKKITPTLHDALWVGLAQTAALCLPGLSRLATTFTALRLCAFNSKKAFSYAWLVQVPLLGAAMSKCIFFAVHNDEIAGSLHQLTSTMVLGATIGSYFLLTLSAYCAIHNYFWIFGIYMLVPLIVSLVL